MNRKVIVFALVFPGAVFGQDAFNYQQAIESLKSQDSTRQIQALTEIHAGVEGKIKQVRKGGTQAVLDATRSFLEPVKSGILLAADDKNSGVRAMSVSLLGYVMPGDQVENVLIKSAQDKVPDVQYAALGGLYLIGGDTIDSREIIVGLLSEDKNDNLFRTAAQLASAWQIPEAIPPMIKALRNNDPFFKQYAARFLAAYGTDASAALPELTAQLAAAEDPALKASLQSAIDKIKANPPQQPKVLSTTPGGSKNQTMATENSSTSITGKSSPTKPWALMILVGIVVVGGGIVIYRMGRK